MPIYGRLLHHDPRSRAYRVEPPRDTPLQTVTHRLTIPVLTQRVGSCVLNTQIENLSWEPVAATLTAAERAQLTQNYAEDLYRETSRADPFSGAWEPDDTGTDALSAAKVLRKRGLISGWLHAFSPATALQQLQQTPVQLGITWRSGCDNPDTNGIIRWTGSIRGGHEVLAIGYDAPRQLVRIRNHWGADWGLGGECWLPVADFTAALADDGDALVIVPRTQPAPTPSPDVADLAALTVWAADPHSYRKSTAAAKAWRGYADRHHL